jgi:hypothetical protein
MKTIEILELTDVQAAIDQAFGAWVMWSEEVMTKLSTIEDVQAVEERLASGEIYTSEYNNY